MPSFLGTSVRYEDNYLKTWAFLFLAIFIRFLEQINFPSNFQYTIQNHRNSFFHS